MSPVLLVPGIGNSGPDHWQSLWEAWHPDVRRVEQADWNRPVLSDWALALNDAILAARTPPIVVAHSLGCLVTAQWASTSSLPCHAILLVAVPNPRGPKFPVEAVGFESPPRSLGERLVIIVSSSNDPYSSPAWIDQCVADWQAELVELGPAGHINVASGLGNWPAGWDLVERLSDPRKTGY